MSEPPVPSEQPNPVLWERRHEVGLLYALYGTIRDVLLHPQDFFSRMPVTGGLAEPLLFCIIVSTVVGLIDRANTFLFEPEKLASFSRTFVAVTTILIPFTTLLFAFLLSGIAHLFIKLFGGANRGFEATFRISCYCAATCVFSLIPLYGTLITFVALIFYPCVGLKHAHRTTTGKAISVCIVTLIVLMVTLFIFAVTVFPALGITPVHHASS